MRWMILTGLMIAMSAGTAFAADEPPKPPIQVGEKAPDFLLKTLNPDKAGRPVLSTKQVLGSRAKVPAKALVLSFAASYCKPCKKELPELQEVEPRFREHGIVTSVVLLDKDADAIESMRKWLVDELGLTLPVVSDRYGIVGRRYGAHQLPMLVIVAPDGVVRFVQVGFSEDTLGRLEAALTEIAGLPKAAPDKGKRSKKKPRRGRAE